MVIFIQGKMDAAASMIEKAIIANPTYAEAYNNLGNEQPTNASETLNCVMFDLDFQPRITL